MPEEYFVMSLAEFMRRPYFEVAQYPPQEFLRWRIWGKAQERDRERRRVEGMRS